MIRHRTAAVLFLGRVAMGCNEGVQAVDPAPPGAVDENEPLSVPENALASYEGRGNTTTPAFKVADDWELHWDHKDGASIKIDLLAEGSKPERLVDERGKIAGTVGLGDGGRYRLRIRTEGAWAVGIVQPQP